MIWSWYIFQILGFFLPSPKLIFPFVLVQVLNYWANFSLFWNCFSSQHLLGLLNFFFVLKNRVIKLLIIYLILKIIKYININKGAVRCGLCGFLIIKPQTTLHLAMRCNITCGAIQLCHFAGGFGAVCAIYAV